jgi:Fe-S protein assembly co-chaperone HscB
VAQTERSQDACERCGRPLESTVACLECGALLLIDEEDPFRAFGIERAHQIDAKLLRKKLLKLQRATHPDFFATQGDVEREAAERATSSLNAAFEILSDELRRADWLVSAQGGPSRDDERQMPQAFLMEVMEWNEVLEEARDGSAGDPSALGKLTSDLEAARTEELAGLELDLTPLPPAGDERLRTVRRRLNALRYIDRALGEITTLTR